MDAPEPKEEQREAVVPPPRTGTDPAVPTEDIDDAIAATSGAALPPAVRPRLLRRRLLLILVIAVAIVAAAVGITSISLYHEATKIDRSSPTVAVRQFLNAVFVERDAARVALFTCGQWTPDQASRTMNEGMASSIKVSWEDIVELPGRTNQAIVAANLRLRVSGYTDVQQWNFTTVLEDGWRVCGGKIVGSR